MDSSDMKNNIVFIIVTYVLMPYCARAQSGSTYNDSSTSNQNIAYSNLDPTVAIIMIVLFSVLFLMVFISIYIRQCSESVAAPATHRPSYSARTGHLGTGSDGSSCYCHRGLDPAVINSFPVLAYMSLKELESGRLPGSLSECAVCLGEFKELDSLKQLLKCNHVFHPKCIDAWLASHVTCPVCRANLELKLEPDSCPRCGGINNRGNSSSSSSSNGNSNDNTVVTNLVLNESNLQQQQQLQPSVSIVVDSRNDVVWDLGNSSSSSNSESRGLVGAAPLGGGGGTGGDNTNESFFPKNSGLIGH